MNPVLTEVTTGATDAIIALLAIGCAALILPYRSRHGFKVRVWLGVFGLLIIASALGAVAHGLDLDPTLRDRLWQPLYLALGLMLGMLAVAALTDGWGLEVGRRGLPIAVVLGLVFYGVTVVADGAFLVFVAYEAIALIFALVVYGRLAAQGRPGAALLTAGVIVTLAAAIVQQTDLSMTLIWPFDHNGIFHLVQMPGLVLLALGVRRSLHHADSGVSQVG